jgi:hypothetical protein
MIRIAQHAKELERLVALEKDDEADIEFERVANALLGIDFGDLFEADVERIDPSVQSAGIAAGVCRSLGYDIMISETEPLTHWYAFSVLIVAKSEGIVPAEPGQRAARRLAIAADDLLHADEPEDED